MEENNTKAHKLSELRKWAEAILQKRTEEAHALSNEEIDQLLEYLRVYHLELDIQNQELQKAQKALETSRQKYEEFYNLAPVGYMTLDQQGRIVEVNLTGAEMLGMRKPHLLNHLFTEFVATDYQDVFYLHCRELSKSQTPQKCELKLVKKNGEQFYARLESWPVQDETGNLEQIRIILIDIHDRKVAEEALWDSEIRYTTLFNSANDIILIYDLTTGQILDVNQTACELLGYSKQDLWGMTILDIDMQEPLISIPKQIETLHHQDRVVFETTYLRSDKTTIPVEVSGRKVEYKKVPVVLNIARDITERKQAEKALRESEERYRRITDAITDYIYTVQVENGKAVETIHSPVCVAVTGYTIKEFQANPYLWIEMVYQEDRLAVKARAAEVLLRKTVEPLEHRIIRKDGARRWVRSTFVLHHDTQGNLVSYDGLLQDVTERKQVEEELKKSEALYRSTIDAMTDAIHVIDADLKITLFNARLGHWCKKLGIETDNNIGRTVFDIFPFLPEKVRDEYRQVFKTGTILITEENTILGEREIITETRKIPIMENGKVSRIITVIRDITERKQAEQTLRDSEERFRTVANFTYDWEYWIDPNGKYLYISPSCEQITGYRPAEFINDPELLERIIHPEDRPKITSRLHNKLQKETTQAFDFRIITRNGEERWIGHVSQPVYGVGGKWLGWRASNRDITDRKQVEEALRGSKERYQRITNAITDYIYTVRIQNGLPVETIHRPACVAVTGYTVEEFQINPFLWIEMVYQEDRMAVKARAAEGLLGKTVEPLEHRIIRKDGAMRWVRSTFVPHHNDKGELLSYDGLIQDITERKQAEIALQESEERYKHFFNNAQVGLFRSKLADGKILSCNELFAQRTGYLTPEECCADYVASAHYVDPEGRSRMLQELLTEGKVDNYEIQITKKDGTPVWVSFSAKVCPKEGFLEGAVIDITARKRAEESFQEAHARLEATLNALPDLLFEMDRHGRIHDFRSPDPELLHLPPEQFLGRRIHEVLPEEVASVISTAITQAVETGHHFGAVHPLKVPKGICWFELSIAAKGDPKTPDGRLIVLSRNITDRKQAEIALQQERDKIQQYLSIAGVMLMVINPDQVVTMINKKGCEILGYKEEEIIGKNWFDHFLPTSKKEAAKATFIKLMHEDVSSVQSFESWVLTKNGEEKVIAWHNTVLRDEEGKIIGILSSGEDITIRQLLEDSLRESKERYKRITNAITDYIYTVRIENGRPAGTIHRPACVAVTGYTVEEFQANSFLWIDMVYEEDRELVKACVARLLAGVKENSLEHRIIKKDGTLRWVRSTFVPHYDSKGKLLSYDGLIQDITERKEAEIALRESEERLRLLVDSAGDMIAVHDAEGKYLYYNGASRYQMTAKDLVGKNPFEVFDTETATLIVHQIKAVAASGQSQVFENQEVLQDKTLWFSDHVFPVRSDEGKITAVAKLRLNITERKQAEIALRESEENYRTLFENSPISLWEIDLYKIKTRIDRLQNAGVTDLRTYFETHPKIVTHGITMVDIARVNKTTLNVFKANSKEEFGHGFKNIFTKESFTTLKEEIIALVEGKTVSESEVIAQTLTGAKLYLDISWIVIPGYEETLSKVLIAIVDITDRKIAEEALRESKEFLQRVLDNSPNNIFVKDQNGVFILVNKQMAESYLTTPEAMIGKTQFALPYLSPINVEEIKKFLADDQEVLRTKQPKFIPEAKFTMPDGRIIWYQTTKVPLAFKDSPDCVLGVATNITDRKQAEEKLKQMMAELERSNRELEQFAYVASHDLQQPLNIVALYMQRLERRYQGKLDAEAKEFIEGSLEVISRMQDLIKDLLAYSQLNKGGIELEPTDCEEVFAKALANLQVMIEEHNGVITCDPLPTVIANDFHLIQLFQNLLGNAIKFHSDKPPCIHVSVEQRGDEWLFSIQDNGIGIASHHLGLIFFIFERLHSRDKYPGTGIGLATCKKIVEIHGGRIWVESQLGQGSTFYFTIPRGQVKCLK